VRQIDFRLEFFLRRMRSSTCLSAACFTVFAVKLPYAFRFIYFDGAGVRLFFRDTNLRQDLEYHLCFHLEFPR
jgi:hypothetical protein